MNHGPASRLSALQHLILWEIVFQEAQNRSWDYYRMHGVAMATLNLLAKMKEVEGELFGGPDQAAANIRNLLTMCEQKGRRRLSNAELSELRKWFLVIERARPGAMHRYYQEIGHRERKQFSQVQNRYLTAIRTLLADILVGYYASQLGIRVQQPRDRLDEFAEYLNRIEFELDADGRPQVKDRESFPGPLDCSAELHDWITPAASI